MSKPKKKPIRPCFVEDVVGNYQRFVEGDNFDVSGLPFRVRFGKHRDGDLRLEWMTPAGWRPIEMAAALAQVDFFYENEHRLFPPSEGYAGGEYFLAATRRAVRHGWKHAADVIRTEREWRMRRQQLPGVDW